MGNEQAIKQQRDSEFRSVIPKAHRRPQPSQLQRYIQAISEEQVAEIPEDYLQAIMTRLSKKNQDLLQRKLAVAENNRQEQVDSFKGYVNQITRETMLDIGRYPLAANLPLIDQSQLVQVIIERQMAIARALKLIEMRAFATGDCLRISNFCTDLKNSINLLQSRSEEVRNSIGEVKRRDEQNREKILRLQWELQLMEENKNNCQQAYQSRISVLFPIMIASVATIPACVAGISLLAFSPALLIASAFVLTINVLALLVAASVSLFYWSRFHSCDNAVEELRFEIDKLESLCKEDELTVKNYLQQKDDFTKGIDELQQRLEDAENEYKLAQEKKQKIQAALDKETSRQQEAENQLKTIIEKLEKESSASSGPEVSSVSMFSPDEAGAIEHTSCIIQDALHL